MNDASTIDIYEMQAREYEQRMQSEETPGLTEFLNLLPAASHILDLGCGPGIQAQSFLEKGHQVDAIDAAQAMIERAQQRGVNARQLQFHELDQCGVYDGIWANFSLLHLKKSDLPAVLDILHNAIKPNGIFHIAMKLGTGEAHDRLGRFYAYYQADELTNVLVECGFHPLEHAYGSGVGLEGSLSEWVIIRSHARKNG